MSRRPDPPLALVPNPGPANTHVLTTGPYVSRGGQKLEHALREFAFSVNGLVCADFGCSTGGFTDCLLKHGAARVYAIDTAYGQLAWTLRNDPRVVVMERTNALHAPPPPQLGPGLDLVVADAGWTPQRLLIPAAARWLRPGGRVISLIKPHYELKDRRQPLPRSGILPDPDADRIAAETIASLHTLGATVLASTRSPIRGGAAKGGKGTGNVEWLTLLEFPPRPDI